MDCADWISIGISLMVFLFSLFVYFVHDKDIKNLQKEKLERELLEDKRAKLDIIYQSALIFGVLTIKNIGKVIARNIVVEIKDEPDLLFDGDKTQAFIPSLEPTEKQALQLQGKFVQRMVVTLHWDDDSGKGLSQNFHVEKYEGNEF